jgi:hypothetical protein
MAKISTNVVDFPRKSKAKVKEKPPLATFSKALRKLRRDYDANPKDFDSDAAQIATLRAVLDMSINMVPILEKQIIERGDGRGVYSLNTLVNQIREAMNDLRAVNDRTEVAANLFDKVVDPTLSLIVQQLVTESSTYRKLIFKEVKDVKVRKKLTNQIKRNLKATADYIKETRMSIREQILEILER